MEKRSQCENTLNLYAESREVLCLQNMSGAIEVSGKMALIWPL